MKRSVLFASVAGLVLVGGAIGVSAFSNNGSELEGNSQADRNLITMEKAKEIAVQVVDGTVKGVELEQEDSGLKYEVKIQDHETNDDHKVQVDAVTGNVTKIEISDDGKKVDVDGMSNDDHKTDDNSKSNDDTKADDNSKSNDDTKADDNSKSNDDTKADDNSKSNDDVKADDNSKGTVQTNNKMITSEQAIAIATKDTPGKVVKVELDDSHYEIEIKTDNLEIEYKIDSKTGMILEKEIDQEDDY